MNPATEGKKRKKKKKKNSWKTEAHKGDHGLPVHDVLGMTSTWNPSQRVKTPAPEIAGPESSLAHPDQLVPHTDILETHGKLLGSCLV